MGRNVTQTSEMSNMDVLAEPSAWWHLSTSGTKSLDSCLHWRLAIKGPNKFNPEGVKGRSWRNVAMTLTVTFTDFHSFTALTCTYNCTATLLGQSVLFWTQKHNRQITASSWIHFRCQCVAEVQTKHNLHTVWLAVPRGLVDFSHCWFIVTFFMHNHLYSETQWITQWIREHKKVFREIKPLLMEDLCTVLPLWAVFTNYQFPPRPLNRALAPEEQQRTYESCNDTKYWEQRANIEAPAAS